MAPSFPMVKRTFPVVLFVVLVGSALAQAKKQAAPAPLPQNPGSVVTAKSVYVIEERSGKVLWSRLPDAKRFPASTTKILTTLLLLEHCNREELITATPEVEEIEGSSLHLKSGEQMSAWEMAHALMIRSANDGSYATALHISGSVPKFAKLMNERAKEIGCTSSHFNNPNGLPDPEHWTTAHDLALIAREAMSKPEFREIAACRKYEVSRTVNQEDKWLISKNKFLAWDPTTDGIKTGYTVAAGHCFVGSATRNGFRVITVVLASKEWKADYSLLTKWAFANYTRVSVGEPGQVIGKTSVSGGASQEVEVVLKEPVLYACKKGTQPNVQCVFEIDPGLKSPIIEGTTLGTAVFSDSDGWSFRTPIVAGKSVAIVKPAMASAGGHWSIYAIAGMLGVSAYWMRRKARGMAFRAFGK